jgi:hypothetical protein
MMSPKIKSVSFLALLLAAIAPLTPALPSDYTDGLVSLADESLKIVVTNVVALAEEKAGEVPDECKVFFDVEAQVVGVSNTTFGFTEGDTITFQSWYIDPANPMCLSYVGPISPPLLMVGWCGEAFLKDAANTKTSHGLELAAYGYSLSATNVTDACDGVMAVKEKRFVPGERHLRGMATTEEDILIEA